MRRRNFLAGSALLPLLWAAGCQSQAVDLLVYLLEGSVPVRLLKGFRQAVAEQQVRFEEQDTLWQLFQQLQRWAQETEARVPDWVTLGDGWLEAAIGQQLIQPIAADDWLAWQGLAPLWQQLVRRESEEAPQIWGIPYRWGSLMMVYNPRHWPQPPQRWQDLLQGYEMGSQGLSRPSPALILPNQPQLLIALALKLLDRPAATADLSTVPELAEVLEQLHQNVRFYSSDHYLEPLVLGDATLAVGWSTDILPMLQRYRQFAAAIPEDGTLLTADLWVRPVGRPAADDAAAAWVNYCLDPQVAVELAIYSQGGSPEFWQQPPPEALASRPLLTLSAEQQRRSEFVPQHLDWAQQPIWQTLQTLGA